MERESLSEVITIAHELQREQLRVCDIVIKGKEYIIRWLGGSWLLDITWDLSCKVHWLETRVSWILYPMQNHLRSNQYPYYGKIITHDLKREKPFFLLFFYFFIFLRRKIAKFYWLCEITKVQRMPLLISKCNSTMR